MRANLRFEVASKNTEHQISPAIRTGGGDRHFSVVDSILNFRYLDVADTGLDRVSVCRNRIVVAVSVPA